MTIASVREDLARRAPGLVVQESGVSTATVAEAAAAIGVEPGQIAKTMALMLDEPMLIVLRGDARLDNARFRQAFGRKPRMIAAEAVEQLTGHPVGGVCPFGLATQLKIVCDISLRAFQIVYPAAGERNSWVSISPEELARLCKAEWVDVSKLV